VREISLITQQNCKNTS